MGRLLLWVGLETVCSCLVEPAGKMTASSQNCLFKNRRWRVSLLASPVPPPRSEPSQHLLLASPACSASCREIPTPAGGQTGDPHGPVSGPTELPGGSQDVVAPPWPPTAARTQLDAAL